MYTVLLVIHTILVLFLIMMVLLQRTDSDGLGGLSGGGGNQFLTGRGAANLMTRTTAILAGAFMLTSLILAIMASHMTSHSIIDSAVPAEESKPLEKSNEAPATPTAIPGKQDVIDATKPADKAAAVKKEAAPAPVKAAPAKTAPSVPKPE